MKILKVICPIIILVFGCTKSIPEETKEKEIISGVLKAPIYNKKVPYKGLKIINNSRELLTIRAGEFIDKDNTIAEYISPQIESGEEVILKDLPTDKEMHLWAQVESGYLKGKNEQCENYQDLNNLFILKKDGTYLLEYEYLTDETFSSIKESSTTATIDNSDPDISDNIIYPQIHLKSPAYKNSPMTFIRGNFSINDTTHVKGILEVMNRSNRDFKYVRIDYNFLDSKGNRSFKEDVGNYIDGDIIIIEDETKTHGLLANAKGRFKFIDSFADFTFPVEDIAAIEIEFSFEEVESLEKPNASLTVISESLVKDDVLPRTFIYNLELVNNTTVPLYKNTSVLYLKNDRDEYIDWAYILSMNKRFNPGKKTVFEKFIYGDEMPVSTILWLDSSPYR